MNHIGGKIRLIMVLSLALAPVAALFACACPRACRDARAVEDAANPACCNGRLTVDQAPDAGTCCESHESDSRDNQTDISRQTSRHETCIHAAAKSAHDLADLQTPALRSVPALPAAQLLTTGERVANPGDDAPSANGFPSHA